MLGAVFAPSADVGFDDVAAVLVFIRRGQCVVVRKEGWRLNGFMEITRKGITPFGLTHSCGVRSLALMETGIHGGVDESGPCTERAAQSHSEP